jgi:hypothetical protein
MSIGKRVSKAFDELLVSDTSEALFELCAAVEETAVREGRPEGKKSYKEFLRANADIICGFGMGIMLAGFYVHYSHSKIKLRPDGTCAFEDIIYHAFRCGHYHKASILSDIVFTENSLGGKVGGPLNFPRHLIMGILMAVVASPANASETCNPGHYVILRQETFILTDWWGRSVDLRARMKTILDATVSK